MVGLVDGWTDRQTNGCNDRWMSGLLDGWMDSEAFIN